MMHVRNATFLDLPAIMEIEKVSFVKEIQESEETYTERIDVFPFGCFVLEDDQKVVGFFSSELWALNKENIIEQKFELNHSCKETNCPNGEILYISSFALLPSCRGKNLGKFFFEQSLNQICTKFTQIKMLALHVNVEWKSAIHIYESFGFEIKKREKNCFKIAENQLQDGFFMLKTL